MTSKENKDDKHKYDVELKPLEDKMRVSVFGSDYVSDSMVALHLKTKFSWSGDTMSIKDQTGETWFYVKGNAWSFSDVRIIFGKDEKPLFVIAHKVWWNPLNDDQVIFDCRGIDDPKEANQVKKVKSKILFTVKSNFGNTKQSSTVSSQPEGATTAEAVNLVGKCIWFQGKCAIWRDGDYKTGGTPLATFMSPVELQRFIGYKSGSDDPTQDFYLTVAPGADIALMVAFVLAVREMEESYN